MSKIKLTREILREYTDKIKDHEVIKELEPIFNALGGATLVGGAVVDIIEGRKPKDYDFVDFGSPYLFSPDDSKLESLLDKGFEFVSETSFAYTYMFKNHTIQFIKKPLHEFEFKISQSSYKTSNGRLSLHRNSFENKQLIPTNFHSHTMLLEGLLRVPHWNSKGYTMNFITYTNVLSVLNKELVKSSN